jgi:hypothetical protein
VPRPITASSTSTSIARFRISGTVTQLRLVNPHSWLHLDVTEPDGKVTKWRCELRGASVLRRSGWSADMFAAGTRVTITGAPDRFTPNTCYLGTAVFSDGRRVDRYGQLQAASETRVLNPRAARRPDGRPNLAGDWAAEQRMLTDPRGISGAFVPLSVAKKAEPGSVPAGMQAFPGAKGTGGIARRESGRYILESTERVSTHRRRAAGHRQVRRRLHRQPAPAV